jgi:MHS family alpha-ketoglutarate permease-like MFS transporter
MTAALALFMLMQPLAGLLSDRIGRKPVMIFFGAAGMLLTWPIFTALEQVRDPVTAFFLVMASLVIVTGYTSINAVVKAELFPGHIRALGVALPYAIANALFGGTAEPIALALKGAGHERWFYVYVSVVIGLSLITYATMRDTKRTSLIED